ncbi:hypothetical protein STEG23_033716 [Scotinomys teguina]
MRFVLSEVEHLRRHPRPPVPNSPGKINVGYCTGSSLFQKAVHHNPDGEPLGSEVEHLRRHPRPPVPNSPGKINVGYCTGSSLFQKAVHHNPDGEPLGSEVEYLRPLPRPPVRNRAEVHQFPYWKPLGSEVEHLLRPLPRPPVRNSPVHVKSKQKTSIRTGTSVNEPEQRTKREVRSNGELHDNPDGKPLCSEADTPVQRKLILKKPFNINTEVDNNIKLKLSQRLSEKPGPCVPGTTIKDNDSTVIIKRTPLVQKRKKEHEGDHHSAPSHSENPSVKIEDKIIDALSVSDYMSLMEAIEKDVQKAASEILEKYKHYYICGKKEQPHSLRRRQNSA